MADRLLVLGWHNAEPTPFFPSARSACVDGLARQLSALRRVASVVPLETAVEALAAGRPLPPRAVALTFDDGYRDNLTTAIPMLRHLGLPATFYLVPGFLDRSVGAWWEVLAWAFARARTPATSWRGRVVRTGAGDEARRDMLAVAEDLKELDAERRDAELDELWDELRPTGSREEVAELFLDWDGARVLAGAATVGSHSWRHAILGREDAQQQRRDLRESRAALESGLSTPVTTLAYPNGTAADFDDTTLEAGEAAGYRAAVTTIDGWNDAGTPRLELRRFVVDPVRGLGGLRGAARAAGRSSLAGGR